MFPLVLSITTQLILAEKVHLSCGPHKPLICTLPPSTEFHSRQIMLLIFLPNTVHLELYHPMQQW